MIGHSFAHYKILETIGSGGMDDVYLAEDIKLDRKVALKVLPPETAQSEKRRERFKREGEALTELRRSLTHRTTRGRNNSQFAAEPDERGLV